MLYRDAREYREPLKNALYRFTATLENAAKFQKAPHIVLPRPRILQKTPYVGILGARKFRESQSSAQYCYTSKLGNAAKLQKRPILVYLDARKYRRPLKAPVFVFRDIMKCHEVPKRARVVLPRR